MLRVAAGRILWRPLSSQPSRVAQVSLRSLCSAEDPRNEPRESMEFDVVIVGAGPAGLSAAIKLRQLAIEADKEVTVCVVEKGSEVGDHILSGNCFEPRALDELIPDWKEQEAPLTVPAASDHFHLMLNDKSSIEVPHFMHIPTINNEGNYIISLSKFTRWLAEQAEELDVEIYPGFAAVEVLYHEDGSVKGIATGDMGLDKNGKPKETFSRGMELHAKQTLLGEGCRGSLTKVLEKQFNLRTEDQFQTYALGVKEVWKIDPAKHEPGKIVHSVGWPLNHSTYGGGFLYHMEDNMVTLGHVVALDYENPTLSPYEEFQRWKHHPAIAKELEGGECIAYGARSLNEGGLQSIPKLTFPGGALIGCSAGFLNVPKIKGTHTAMKSGMLAAEAIFPLVSTGQEVSSGAEPTEYERLFRSSWVYEELHAVRNVRPAFHFAGLFPFLAYTWLDQTIFRGKLPWTLSHGAPDHEHVKPIADVSPIQYPKPDGKLSFDLLSNLARSGTNHDHNSPAHLKPASFDVPTQVNLLKFGGPEQYFCPARVYEFSEADDPKDRRLVINAQNCLHCKACDIKDPTQNITWTCPEGGGGPKYTVM